MSESFQSFSSLSLWSYFLLLWFVPAIGYWQSRHSHVFCTLRQKTSRSTMRQGPCLILKTVISKWVEEPDKSTIGYWKSQSIHVLCTLETTTTSTAQLPSQVIGNHPPSSTGSQPQMSFCLKVAQPNYHRDYSDDCHVNEDNHLDHHDHLDRQ